MRRKAGAPVAVVTVASLVALAAGLAAAAQRARSSPLTSRFARSAKIWKLSARNSTRFAAFSGSASRRLTSFSHVPDPFSAVFSS